MGMVSGSQAPVFGWQVSAWPLQLHGSQIGLPESSLTEKYPGLQSWQENPV